MNQTLQSLILGLCLAMPVSTMAQQAGEPQTDAPEAAVAAEETDVGTLQAELARVEAERQRLAQRLANSADTEELQRLRETNRELQNQQIENSMQARAMLEKQRQQWFMVGGGTVLVSLLIGFLLARSSKRKRNEWIN
ncbi:translation initiation factor 2 [Halopseudomonas sp.]|uniref:translation initiation factor 2 n=1 Tax=Halopseudomonas sp. TaxID=2901191 RepID=UPI00356232E3